MLMNTITRRDILGRGLALAAPLPLIVTSGADRETLAAVAHWREVRDRAVATETIFEDHPELEDRQAPALQWPARRRVFDVARARLLQARPVTPQGALALLGCAVTVIEWRNLAKRSDREGTIARRLYCYGYQGDDQMTRIAHRALARLAGEPATWRIPT